MNYDAELEKIIFKLNSYRKIKFKKSVAVTKDFLEKLNKLFDEYYGKGEYDLRYICELLNGKSQEYESYQNLIECDNALERSIIRLEITAKSHKNSSFYTRIVVVNNSFNNLQEFLGLYTVIVEIEGDHRNIIQFEEELSYQIRKIARHRTYTFLSKAGIIFTLAIACLCSFIYYHYFGLPTTYGIPLFNLEKTYDATTLWGRIAPYAKLGLTGFCAAISIRFPVKKIFPRAAFLFGSGINNELKKSELRSKIVWNIIIALIISIVGAYLYGWLSGNL